MPRENKALTEAQAGLRPAVEKVIELGGRCMEQTIDSAGIVWERWLLPNGGASVILFGTPHWRDVFVSVSPGAALWTQTFEALANAARSTPVPAASVLPKWRCPKCRSQDVQISLPAWHTETRDGTLTYVETDAEAEVKWWYCDACGDTDSGEPDKAGP